mmetsp:Transcript_40151/g.64525  ORF Transcript_40151/g.64525 Transcript_40151/m.64525 type:complete len:307 (+) Transcript_40151:59-979(+)
MWRSLRRFSIFPDSCLVFPGHEYTESLRWFGCWLQPGNEVALAAAHEAQALRTQLRPTVPGSMGMERKINPWLRAGEPLLDRSVSMRVRQYRTVPFCMRQWTCTNYAPTEWYDISTPPPPLDGEYGDGVITALASSPSAWKRVDGGGRSKGREMKETKEIGLRMNLPPTGRQQPQSANKAAGAASSSAGAAGTPLWPLVHPASARSNYSGMAETDRKEGNGVDEESKKEEDKIADTFKKIRALQQLFDTLIPARHFHLRGRRGGALAVQLQTESMVWADGHIYLTSDLFSREPTSTFGQSNNPFSQ